MAIAQPMRPHSSLGYLTPNAFVMKEQDQRPVMQRAGTLRYVGPPRPGPLLNRPLGTNAAIRGSRLKLTMVRRIGAGQYRVRLARMTAANGSPFVGRSNPCRCRPNAHGSQHNFPPPTTSQFENGAQVSIDGIAFPPTLTFVPSVTHAQEIPPQRFLLPRSSLCATNCDGSPSKQRLLVTSHGVASQPRGRPGPDRGCPAVTRCLLPQNPTTIRHSSGVLLS